MGRPYKNELAAIDDTVDWASRADIAPIRRIIEAVASTPLVLVGSGGSLTACELVARLHAEHACQPARVMTPYEFSLFPCDTASSTWLFSAGGSNRDILAAAEKALTESQQMVGAIVARAHSKLSERLRTSSTALSASFEPPFGRDGFLAVNSLISTALLVTRAYESVFSWQSDRPLSLRQLDRGHGAQVSAALRPSVLVLAAGWSWPAARDLESKFNEIGLGTVVCTDHRNFAHGRHHGLAVRAAESGVIALSTPDCIRLAELTLRSIPPRIPRLHLTTVLEKAHGTIDLISQVFQLVDLVAEHTGVDPGRPHVAEFGRRLFNMGIPRSRRRTRRVDLWLQRKVTPIAWRLATEAQREVWRSAYQAWAASVLRSRYVGLALDYDGTLCHTLDRTAPPLSVVTDELSRLLREGLEVGIATGRGGSVIGALKASIPQQYHGGVLVGFYNGGFIESLSQAEARLATWSMPSAESLEHAEAALSQSLLVSSFARLRRRPTQLTITGPTSLPAGLLYRTVVELLSQDSELSHSCVIQQSGHSVDVVPWGVSKLAVVDALRARIGDSILAMGDQGQAGGNDHLLLSRQDSLSVDLVSTAVNSCWNLAPAGLRGPMALVQYLRALRPASKGRGHELHLELLEEL